MLYKKELEEVPILKYIRPSGKKRYSYSVSVEIVTLPRSGEILVADFFSVPDKRLSLRFFSDGKNYKTLIGFPERIWTERNPRTTCDDVYSTEETDTLVSSFLKEKYHIWWGEATASRIIGNFVSGIQCGARDKAQKRKEDLRDKHFSMFPAMPDDLGDYCEQNIFDHGYIFISKLDQSGNRTGFCSHCRKRFRADRSARNGWKATCPKCGWPAVYRRAWEAWDILDTEKICIAHRVDGQLLVRWAEIHRTIKWPKFSQSIDAYDYAYNLHLNTESGQKLYFYKYIIPPFYYGYSWYRGKNGDVCWDSTYIYTKNLNEVFGDRYYNVDLQKGLEGKHIKLCFSSLLNHLREYPETEYLFKLDMPLLAAGLPFYDSKAYGPTPTFSDVLGVSKQLQPLYRAKNVTPLEHRIIKAAGEYIREEDLDLFRSLKIKSYDVNTVTDILQRMSFQKFCHYFKKQKERHKGRSISYLLMKYRDYLDMSEGLGVDMGHKSVRYPTDCVAAHDTILPRYNEHIYEIEDKLFMEKTSDIYSGLRSTDYEKDGYCIVLPHSRSDFITEGQSLNHCVGMEQYYKNHIAGRNLIFFVRRTEDRTKPFFTMEVSMESMRILQLYGFGDCTANKEVRQFAESFVRTLRLTSMTA